MTTGRFETTWNCRPDHWDQRFHWTMPHHKPCQRDHMERESCPFHDLRAEGCFQPEYGSSGAFVVPHSPDKLTARPAGQRMKTGAAPAPNAGMGGLPLPIDTDASAIPAKLARNVSSRPWTTTAPTKTVFQTLKRIPDPPVAAAPPVEGEDDGAAGPLKVPFRSGKGSWNNHIPHVPDPYDDRQRSRPVFRLAAGAPRPTAPTSVSPVRPHKSLPPAPRTASVKVPSAPRNVFDVRKPLLGTFGYYHEYIPTPWSQGSMKCERRPIFTYHAQSKRSMPVMVPWSTGIATAEPTAVREK